MNGFDKGIMNLYSGSKDYFSELVYMYAWHPPNYSWPSGGQNGGVVSRMY
jgi:hypothetical protein